MRKVFARNYLWLAVHLSAIAFLLGGMPPCPAAIIPTGNVEPGGTWGSSTTGYVGNTSDGSLLVDAGSLLQSKHAYIAYYSAVSGTATVTGAGSTWNNSNVLLVGYSGSGVLCIEAGGQIASSQDYLGGTSVSRGTVTVTGAGSKWTNNSLYIGDRGNGTLRIEAGGLVTSSSGYIGHYANSSGTATVTGTGSMWTVGDAFGFRVGDQGNGTLRIETGGQVTSPRGSVVGYYSGSSGAVTVTGSGSKWTNDDGLGLGEFGNGTLRIEAGGQVSSSGGELGYRSGSSGTATITGTGSKWTNSGRLYVGVQGNGTLTVADGGGVSAQTLYASLSSLLGNGTITATKGAVLDADLRFDAAHSTQATLVFGSGGTLTVNAAGGDLGAGYKGNGSLTIAEGVGITSSNGYLGYHSGSSGTATITGAGSAWINTGGLFVGQSGTGTLRIEAGAQVRNSSGYLGYNSGSSGSATITGAGSKWTNSSSLYVGFYGNGTLTVANGGGVSAQALYASLSSLLGNGTITATKGAVLDADLRFDTAHPAQATFAFGSGGTLTVGATGGVLGAGYKGNGTLTIAEGMVVTSSSGVLGYHSGSSGTATVTGAGSKWTNSGDLEVGFFGVGTLRIEAGGQVSNQKAFLGESSGSSGSATITGAGAMWTNNDLYVGNFCPGALRIEAGGQVTSSTGSLGRYNGSSGTATVTGAGSKWTNSNDLYIGDLGTGTLRIKAGGQVAASSVSVKSSSLLTIDVGYGSNLSVGGGTGTITNGGKIRILTGPQQVTGRQYSPIAAGTWFGSGTYQALGGTWDATSHVFTVSETLSGASGTPVAVDLAQRQRVLVNDSSSGWAAGTSFLSKTGTGKTFDFTASAIAGAELTALEGLLEPGQSVLSGWNFTAVGSGYAAADPLYLSFGNGTGGSFTSEKLKVWSYDGTKWSQFAVSDLTFDGSYASFTATSLGCYAVSVPEPETVVMLFILALGGLFWWRRA